jgi:hypothetical protein
MHMVHPGLSTLNTGKNRKKLNAKQQRALAEHDAWLRKQGLHPDQLSKQKTKNSRKLEHSAAFNSPNVELSNTVVSGGFKKTIWDTKWKRTYEDDPLMAEREDDALRKADARKSRLMPLYNKGPVQYCTDMNTLKEGNGRGRNV